MRHLKLKTAVLLAIPMLCSMAYAQTRATLLAPATTMAKSAAPATIVKNAIKREKAVNINFQHIAPDGNAAKEIDLDLFDGQRVTLVMDRIERRSATNYTWYGHVKSAASNTVMLTVVDKQVVGALYIGQTANGPVKHYELQSNAAGGYSLRELDDSRFPDDSRLHSTPPKVAMLVQPQAMLAAGTQSISTSPKKIDVLVAFTNQVANATGGNPAAAIQSAIDSANQTFSNTQLGGGNTRVRLVGSMQVNYNETGVASTDLSALATNASLNTQRNNVGADVVMVLAETMTQNNVQVCGLANAISANAGNAFALVSRACATSNLSFVHEMGHLFGARHDMAVDPTTTPYPYGHGFVDLTNKQYSVMAYNTACANAGITTCVRRPVFSSPTLAVNGFVFGDANSNNAKVVTDNAQRLATFYSSNSLQENGVYSGALSTYTINQVGTSTSFTVTPSTGPEPAVTYDELSANRLLFADATVALDISGVAGKVYRLYQAAFNRKPDLGGLGFWIAQADRGAAMKDIAASFIASQEFINLYGANPSNESFVTSLYYNVLHRAPDPAGYNYWVNILNTNAATRADVLASMSESAENISGVAPSLTHGIQYTRYVM